MLRFHLPNEFSLSTILSTSATSINGGFGKQAHALAHKTSLISHLSVSNSLITMYSACNEEDKAWLVFLSVPEKNSITWNSMISSFQSNGHLLQAFSLFSLMRRDGVPCDHCTLLSLSSSCSSITQCRALQPLAAKMGLLSHTKINTAMVRAYSLHGGEADEIYKLFSEAKTRDLMSWTSIIVAVSGEDNESRQCTNPNQAAILFSMLRREGFCPDRYTFSAMAKALASTSSTNLHPSALHGLAAKLGFSTDVVFSNSLIHAYARSGSIKLAEKVFEELAEKDLVTWNSMIKGYSLHGKGSEALRVFSEMGTPPDAATFVAVLSACSHSGLVEEGKTIFNSMLIDHGVQPQLDHYACMVDLLGRAGHLLDAEALIDQMPMDPDHVIWSGLLAACRKHGSLQIAEKAARRLVGVAPERSAGYVLISNIYSEQRNFVEAAHFWKGMRDSGVKKLAGLSWIEIGNKVHEFPVGGHCHPEIKAIKEELKLIIEKVKEIGYVPETSSVLHDIEEGQKEEQLFWHGEKLALAFGLMKTSPATDSIKIMKNIRICVDCHEFIKLVTNCVSKEIIVRDPNRFHHFKNGVCSCGDYW